MSLLVDLEVPARGVAAAFEVSAPTAIVGPNGAGKTTLIQAIAGLLEYRGTVSLDGRDLDGLPSERRRVGVVFQDYLLFPHLTVLENVAFGPRAQRRNRFSGVLTRGGATRRETGAELRRSEPREVAAAQLERLGIGHLAARHPAELSGGQAQRVALARALAADPEVLLLDEPLAALDVEVRDDVRAELASHLAGFAGVTIVVTHDAADVAALARDVLVLERGRVTQHGSLADLTGDPATPYVRRLTRR